MFAKLIHQPRRVIFTSKFMPKRNKKEQACKSAVPIQTGPVTEKDGSVLIRFLAKPGAKHNSITDIGEEEVGVQIAAPPIDGEANTELIKYLSKLFGVKKSHLTLDKGSRSRNKTVVVSGASRETIESQLKSAVDDK